MPGCRPVAESTVVHVLLIDTFTHSGFYPVGQTTGVCEYAYAFLCSTTLSGDNRNLPAGRKPGRVNKFQIVLSPSGSLPAGRKPECVNEALILYYGMEI
jgi:hypothetical protein